MAARAHVDLGAAVIVGPQVVAGGQRVIQGSGGPLLDAAGPEGDGAAEIVDARDTRGRVVRLRQKRGRRDDQENRSEM